MVDKLSTSAHALIDWTRTTNICMDFSCPCGHYVHYDAWDGQSAQHFQCPWCKDVFKIDAKVGLGGDDTLLENPCVHVQWKGTDVHMSANCSCGHRFEVDGMFQYKIQCPGCQKQYDTASHLQLFRLTSEEITKAIHIQTPEKDLEEMTPEELEIALSRSVQ